MGSRRRVRRHHRLRRSRSRKNVAGGRLCGWVGETEEPEKKILPARWDAWPARESQKFCRRDGVRGRREKKKYCRRDGVRGRQEKKKLYIAGRRDGVRGRREKKKNYIAGWRDGVRGRRGEKKLYIAGRLDGVHGRRGKKENYMAGEMAACPAGEKKYNKNKKQEDRQWNGRNFEILKI